MMRRGFRSGPTRPLARERPRPSRRREGRGRRRDEGFTKPFEDEGDDVYEVMKRSRQAPFQEEEGGGEWESNGSASTWLWYHVFLVDFDVCTYHSRMYCIVHVHSRMI